MKKNICCILVGLCLCACGSEIEPAHETSVIVYDHEKDEIIAVETMPSKVEIAEPEETEVEYDPEVVIDIFKDIEDFIVFDGANGEGMARVVFPEGYYIEKDGYYLIAPEGSSSGYSLSVIYNNERQGTLRFLCDDTNLSEGDTIHIYTNYTDKKLNKQIDVKKYFESIGYVVPITSQDYVTPNLGNYVKDISELSDVQIESIKNEALKEAKNTPLNSGKEKYVISEMYFGTLKPTAVIRNREMKNIVYITYTWEDAGRGPGWGVYKNYGYYIDKDGHLISSGKPVAVRGDRNFELDDKFSYVEFE